MRPHAALRPRRAGGRPDARGGFALIAVILVLAALLVLCTPFMMTARNADLSSSQLFDRAQARAALDSAAVHALAKLERSCAALDYDATIHWDSLEELRVDNRFAADFYDASDATGVMWDLEVTDLAGRIDLNSAPPQLVASLLGGSTRFTRPVKKSDDRLPVASTEGLEPQGYVWVEGELVGYGAIEGNELVDLERGIGVQYDSDDNVLPGPRPASDHGVGAAVLDQRAFAVPLWRMSAGGVRSFDSVEALREAEQYVLADEGLGRAALQRLAELGTVYGDVRGGARWQRAVRLTRPLQAERSDVIEVDDPYHFNEGATIRITDGLTTETALVVGVQGGALKLDRGVSSDYDAYEAVVSVLARRPVNVNTAPPEVLLLLLEGLKVRGRNERITGGEARALTEALVASRPFEGFEDFLRRFVLPAAGIEALPAGSSAAPDAFVKGEAIISAFDALALYANALNANDLTLEVSSMPFCFTSRDVYGLDLRAAVNAPSGAERYSLVREEVVLVSPQSELMRLWGHQEDYDEALRLARVSPWWMSGPHATTRGGGGGNPPSRLWPHMGTIDGVPYLPGVVGPPQGTSPGSAQQGPRQAEHVFAAREGDAYAQLWPSTVPDWQGDQNVFLLHFDHETRDPEGRYLPDETIAYAPDHQDVEWTAGTGLLRALTFSAWVKPQSLSDGHLLDVGGSGAQDADRVSLALEGGDLVLRVLDGGGDHRDTVLKEQVECRYALAAGDGPGMPADTWHHVLVDVRGARPGLMTMLVNGTAHGVRTPGLTRLSGSVSESAAFLPVEDTEGFPDRGVARVGNELVEYFLDAGGLRCQYAETGADAGFGGRNARVRWTSGSTAAPANLAVLNGNHPAGTTVEHYGYSLELTSDLLGGAATLPDDLGSFRVAQVTAVEGGSTNLGDAIQITFPTGATFSAWGLEGASSAVTGLVLAPADDEQVDPSQAQVMNAFSRSGGYAAVIQWRWGFRGGSGNDGIRTVQGSRIGGIEVIRYSGWTGNTLQIAARGAQQSFQNVPADDSVGTGGSRAFITDWAGHTAGGVDINLLLDWQTFVVPISVPVPGGEASFLVPEVPQQSATTSGPGGAVTAPVSEPEFAQITREDQAELTEWVAYDEVVGGHLVRTGPSALETAYLILTNPGTARDVDFDPNNPPPGGGGPGGGGPGGGGATPPGGGGLGGGSGGGAGGIELLTLEPGPSPSPAPAPAAPALAGAYWQPMLGQPDDVALPLTRAVREAMQFRGVLGTSPQAHPAGTRVVPVFHVRYDDTSPDVGRPGRYDSVFLLGADFDHLGWPVQIHRAHRPSQQVPFHDWQQVDPQTPAAAPEGQEELWPSVGLGNGHLYVALTDAAPQAMQAGSLDPTGQAQIEDTRAMTRVTKFPSGERPRDVSGLGVGAGFQQGMGGVLSATVDEVLFAHPEFGMNTPSADPESMQGAPMTLSADAPANASQLTVWPNQLRIPRGQRGSVLEFLSTWDQDAGLVKIGDEILCYESLDATTGTITVAAGGWGLLGTQPQPHAAGESVVWLEHLPVTVLTGNVGAGDSQLPIASAQDFPREGTVRIGDELIHYTRQRGGALEMPAASNEPGRMDGRGPGLFRGRYGSTPAGHGAGEPVILFPFRYWDRWAHRADAPELSCFEFELDQPAAWVRSVFWIDESPGTGNVRLRVLQRTDPDVPWDADPETTDGLDLLDDGLFEDGPIPIGRQTDRVQWRVFVEFTPGAFDPLTGMAHGWRTTPRLRQLGTFLVAPTITLRSLER